MLPSDKVDERLRQYRQDQYIPGATIEHVMKLRAFDFKLQSLDADASGKPIGQQIHDAGLSPNHGSLTTLVKFKAG